VEWRSGRARCTVAFTVHVGAHFALECRTEGDAVRLCVRGDLDLATSAALHQALEDQRRAGRAVLMDLSAVGFMDASGLRVLLEAQDAARRHGQSLAADAHVPPAVSRVLEVTGTGSLLDWHGVMAAAHVH
jgi:stage II sporulation protein AA (anti-sigma F factor antagonist)